MISEAVSIDVGSLGAVGAKAQATPEATPRTLVSSRVVAREAAAAAIVVAGLAALLSPRDLGASVAPHPGWVAVMLLSARYGSRGFGLAFLAVSGALTMSALALDIGLGPLATLASNSAPDLGALVACVLIAWISSGHERRIGDMTARAAELEKKNGDDRAVIAELRDAAVTLRARADRMDHSLTFVRDVARRLEGDDALEGLQAALELALARTGARAGVVQLVEQDRLRTAASLGAWASRSARPSAVFADRTIAAAAANAATARAVDLGNAGLDDSDVAAPIIDGDGKVLGVLALRGVPSDSLRRALVHDVGLVASWCAGACAARGEALVARVAATDRNRPALAHAEDGVPLRAQAVN